MKIKISILTIFFALTFLSNAQKLTHFEQVAFQYYKDSILNKKQLQNDKITISLKVIEDGSYWDIDCLKEFNLRIDDTAAAVASAIGNQDLIIGDDKRFKVKRFKKNNPPMIFATAFMSFEYDKYIVGIVENEKGNMTTYLFEMNKDGEIRKWCKGKFKN